jgi:hypothetical protein
VQSIFTFELWEPSIISTAAWDGGLFELTPIGTLPQTSSPLHRRQATLMETPALAPTRLCKQIQGQLHTSWAPEEDELLTRLVTESEIVSWAVLANLFPTKTAPQLAGRWDKVINPQIVKGSWTREEDETIITFVRANGDKGWAKLAILLPGRTGKQCRERFKNHLDDAVNHEPWSPEEDRLLGELHGRFGNSWTKLATFFEGRTDNCIKNRWNSTVKKRLERMELGQPLVMKRGRKPKDPKPEEHHVIRQTSPVDGPARYQIPSIELMPLTPYLMMKVAVPVERLPAHSLEQNRTEFLQMLTGMSGL